MTTGKRIKDLRKKKGLNQEDLGKIIGLTDSAISSIETERSEIKSEDAIKLSKYFNVSLDYLLTGKEEISTITNEEQAVIELYRKDEQIRDTLQSILDLKKKVINYAKNYKVHSPIGRAAA